MCFFPYNFGLAGRQSGTLNPVVVMQVLGHLVMHTHEDNLVPKKMRLRDMQSVGS